MRVQLRARGIIRPAATAALFLLVATPAMPQTPPEPPGESIVGATLITLDQATSECLNLEWSGERGAMSDNLLTEGCEVASTGQLPAIGETVWSWALYHHTSVWGPDDDTPEGSRYLFPDTIPEIELVVFTGVGGEGQIRPIWHDRVEQQIELLRPPRAELLGQASESPEALLVHRRCLNGTGGCLDHPYRISEDGRFTALRPHYRRQLQDPLSDEWGMWKGSYIDPVRRIVEAPVYLPGDGNCCSSLMATATVVVEGDALVADSIAIEPALTLDAWLVLPGERFGPITPNTGEADLREMLGASSVVAGEIYLAEGFCAPGVRLFPGWPFELELAWADSARARPAFVRSRTASGAWRTPLGVGVGTTLKELEQLRGEPITFSGFGWDYGGGTSWEEHTGTLHLRLDIDPVSNETLQQLDQTDPRTNEIFGDRSVRSDHAIIRQITVQVEEISLYWAATSAERDCEAAL